MSWDFDSNSNKVDFTKFPVGITKIRVLDEAPHMRWVHWMPAHKRTVNCPRKSCPICEIRKEQKANNEPYTYSTSRRFTMNIYNYETNKIEIMEQGIGFFQDLRDLKNDLEEKNQNLKDAIIKVRRRGTSKDDTSYRLDIDEINPDKNLKVELIDLHEYFREHTIDEIRRLVAGENWKEVFQQNKNEEEEEKIVVQ